MFSFVFAAISPTRSAKVVTKMNQFPFMHVCKHSQIHVLKSSLYRHNTWDSALQLDWLVFFGSIYRHRACVSSPRACIPWGDGVLEFGAQCFASLISLLERSPTSLHSENSVVGCETDWNIAQEVLSAWSGTSTETFPNLANLASS